MVSCVLSVKWLIGTLGIRLNWVVLPHALASSCAFPQNWLACTMLMRAGLSSNPLSPTLIVGLFRMLAIVGAENSRRVLLAMSSNSGVKLRLIWLSSDSKAKTFLSLALVLLNNASGSPT